MKAITIWQPWASLIAHGVKKHETRSWAPPRAMIGQRVAIHAAKQKIDQLTRNLPADALRPVVAALTAVIGDFELDDLPLGAVLCTARLKAGYQCGNMNPGSMVYVEQAISDGDDPVLIEADDFGDYSPGRWAWQLDEIEVFDRPIPAVGKQGFWNWTPPSPSRFTAPRQRQVPAPGGFPAIAQE